MEPQNKSKWEQPSPSMRGNSVSIAFAVVTGICAYCGSVIPHARGDYPKRYKNKKYCSQSCRNSARGSSVEYRRVRRNGKLVPLHRAIMEDFSGKPVPDDCVVHHINADKHDNRIENLAVMSHAEHCQLHNQKHPIWKTCAMCGVAYRPHPTKRARSKCCSVECGKRLGARTKQRAAWEALR